MNYLLVSPFQFDGRESGANRLRKLKVGLEAHGHSVFWLAPGQGGDRIGPLKKLAAIVRLCWRAVSWGLAKEGKLIVTLPPPWMVAVAVLISLLFRARVILDFRDPLVNQNINPRGRLYVGFMKWAQEVAVNSSGGVVVAAPRIIHYLPISAREKFVSVLAGIDRREISARQAPFWQRPTKIIYGGTFYGTRSPWPLLRALVGYRGKYTFDFRVDLPGEELEKIRQFVDQHELKSRVAFSPFLPRAKFMAELSGASVALVITHSSGSEYAIPGKIFDYISSGNFLWVITEDAGLLEFISDFHLPALVTPAWEESRLREALGELEARASAPSAAANPAEALTCEYQAKLFLDWERSLTR